MGMRVLDLRCPLPFNPVPGPAAEPGACCITVRPVFLVSGVFLGGYEGKAQGVCLRTIRIAAIHDPDRQGAYWASTAYVFGNLEQT
jgi:hypothetical protein